MLKNRFGVVKIANEGESQVGRYVINAQGRTELDLIQIGRAS